jgi:hypothetical protein
VAGPVVGEFFLGNGSRVFQLIDNGQRIVEEPSLPAGVAVVELAAVAGDQVGLFARGSNRALYLLQGSAWSPVSGGLGGPIAAGANGLLVTGDGGGKLGSPGAVSYSADGGATWRSGSGLPYDQSVEALAGQPSSTTIYAYCYGGDVYESTDGGRDWTLLSRALRGRAG